MITYSMVYKTAIIFIVFSNYLFPQDKYNTSYESILNQLLNISIDSTKAGSIENLTLKKDAGSYYFESGIVYPCKPIAGKLRSAVFIGKGIFNFTPPTKVEKDQLFRFYETRNLSSEFEYVFMMFADSTFEIFEKQFSYENINNFENANEVAKESIRFISDKDKNYFENYLMKVILEERKNGYFFSGYEDENGKLMFFEVDPFSQEEIKLYEGHLFGFKRRTSLDLINSFDADSSDLNYEMKYNDFVEIENYILNVEIEENADFSASAEVKFKPKAEGQKFINFLMYHKFEIDSVTYKSKKYNKYFKAEENSNLWIEFEDELIIDSIYSVTIYYRGDVLERNLNAWFYLKTSSGWFPRYGTRKYSNYDISFKYPESMDLFCVGEKVYETTREDYKYSRWLTKNKIRNASFNIGAFKTFEYSEQGIPKVKVFHSKYGHRRSVRGIEAEVGQDVADAVKYFSSSFGRIDSDSLIVSEIPFYHGEAFPDLIHLSFITFTNTRYSGFDQKFRGHEVAHQWWGINVDFESYHDQWLSEGFAEYSGLLFLQQKLEDEEKFNDILDEYRDEIINNRKQLFWEGLEAGPISLGIRTSSSETLGDYNLIIYRKGAWVLHMLRTMLTDLETKDDSKFMEMMREYYETYKGKKANTIGFQEIVNKYFNENMDWFFDQWVYDTFIPIYNFAYSVEESEKGKHILKCKTSLENPYPRHKSLIPILIKYDNGKEERYKVNFEGDKIEFQFPLVDSNIDEVIFNDLNAVLCQVDYVDWENFK